MPNLIDRFDVIPLKIAASYLAGINKLVLKIIWKDKRPRIAHTALEKKKVREPVSPNIKTYYKPTAIKTAGTGEKTG